MRTPNGRREITAAFGSPANRDGTLDSHWEDENIVAGRPREPWTLYYQSDKRGLVLLPIRIHKLLQESFQEVLSEIWEFAAGQIGGRPTLPEIQKWLHDRRLDQHGGGFNFRPITDGASLSLHSYGIAIDWDPDHNPRQKKGAALKTTLPSWWYDIWTKHGWSDGRNFTHRDPMHVQFATGA